MRKPYAQKRALAEIGTGRDRREPVFPGSIQACAESRTRNMIISEAWVPQFGQYDHSLSGGFSSEFLRIIPWNRPGRNAHPDLARAVRFAGESSRTTHGAAECVDACKLYAAMLHQALSGSAKDAILRDPFSGLDVAPPLSPSIQAIADGAYFDKGEDEISGSGYVVHSLEAALWCFNTTNTYRDAILRAVNLGDDADTTAAVCGQIAGAYYGVQGIPAGWLDRLTMREEIDSAHGLFGNGAGEVNEPADSA